MEASRSSFGHFGSFKPQTDASSSVAENFLLKDEQSGMENSNLAWLKSGNAGRPDRVSSKMRRNLIGASLLLLLLLFYSYSGDTVTGVLRAQNGQLSVLNTTLGFQRVFAIGMAGRSDRRDALAVAASLSGITVDWSDGVQFDDMPEKAIPEAFVDAKTPPPIIASWRAHLNVLSRIVSENIQTALIMEDDSDWDWNIQGQLQKFATGLLELQHEWPGQAPRYSPYGNKWDTLWLGHCRIAPSADKQDFYFITNDTTVPPLGLREGIWDTPYIPRELFANDTRVAFRAERAGCAFGYAITFDGARKALISMANGLNGEPFDVALSGMCQGLYSLSYDCYGIYPSIISSHGYAGPWEGDEGLGWKLRTYRPEGPDYTWDVVYSVIQNVHSMLKGSTDVVSQWPEDTIPSRPKDQKYVDEVSGALRTITLKDMPEQHLKGFNKPR